MSDEYNENVIKPQEREISQSLAQARVERQKLPRLVEIVYDGEAVTVQLKQHDGLPVGHGQEFHSVNNPDCMKYMYEWFLNGKVVF